MPPAALRAVCLPSSRLLWSMVGAWRTETKEGSGRLLISGPNGLNLLPGRAVPGQMPNRVGGRLGPIPKLELGEDVPHVGSHGLRADVQARRDLGVGQAFGQ